MADRTEAACGHLREAKTSLRENLFQFLQCNPRASLRHATLTIFLHSWFDCLLRSFAEKGWHLKILRHLQEHPHLEKEGKKTNVAPHLDSKQNEAALCFFSFSTLERRAVSVFWCVFLAACTTNRSRTHFRQRAERLS